MLDAMFMEGFVFFAYSYTHDSHFQIVEINLN